MTNVWTQAGDKRSERRLWAPSIIERKLDARDGEPEREESEEGDEGGEGSVRLCGVLWRGARPDSRM